LHIVQLKAFTVENFTMASFSAYLYLEGRVYGLAWCCYSFQQYVDQRGRPRSKVRKGSLYVELYALEDCADLWGGPVKTDSELR
jgi:hypothetical protein